MVGYFLMENAIDADKRRKNGIGLGALASVTVILFYVWMYFSMGVT